jgi:hypothetical protein
LRFLGRLLILHLVVTHQTPPYVLLLRLLLRQL